MPLQRILNGVSVELTAQEETDVLAEWAVNPPLTPETRLAIEYDKAVAFLNQDEIVPRIIRSTLILLVNQLNARADTVNAILAAAAAATSLADFKSRMALIPNDPIITKAQALAAMVTTINDGAANAD